MQLLPLASVKSHLALGVALPFCVRNAEGGLLLAAGETIDDAPRLDDLLERGAVVEAQDLITAYGAEAVNGAYGAEAVNGQGPASPSASPPASQLPRLWRDCTERVTAALSSDTGQRQKAIATASRLMLTLVRRSQGLAMSQIVRQLAGDEMHYGITHSMNAAIACVVTARALNWADDDQQRALNAALTMNVAMIDLQKLLARQVSPLTAKQRQRVQEHPLAGAEMLEAAGITDADWLNAVREHHELPDGSGYPTGQPASSELGRLLHHADVYTALMSQRATRPAMSTRDAGRELYQMSAGSPLCQAMIKTFGVFPPGSYVRLASGEIGVVVGNGEKAYHPRVAALTGPDGQFYRQPVLRDTADEKLRIAALLSAQAMPMRVTPEMLALAIDSVN
jgi:HD-GYP domain-containing protein (c-di-GMP phosphodiesterase class II)